MSTAGLVTTAVVTGAIAGAIAGAALARGGRDKAAVTATIALTQLGQNCNVRTLPNGLLVGRRDLVQWNVVGNCDGINLDNVELQFMGPCTAKSTNPQTWTIFTDNGNPRGRKMRRTIASNDEQCVAYRVWHVNTALEDPEIEIVQF
jgi:hypothetical protein